MSNEIPQIGAHVALHKVFTPATSLSIYGEVVAIRRHWDGNPDHLEIQLYGLNDWLSLLDVQLTIMKEESNENDCN
jgi:hypothetical protein